MKLGQHCSFTYKGRQLEGILLKKEGKQLTIKLNSGYNITIPSRDIADCKEVKVKQGRRAAAKKVSAKKGLPKISILHTGGTIASKIDYATGAVVAKYTAEEILGLFPELASIGNLSCTLLGNMQSEMMRFAHWNLMAAAVEKEVKKGAEGIIITHGTDILHMSAAALAFALENCPVPVLLVGSQRSSDRPSSDAASNLLCAAAFIAEQQEFAGVAICMHEETEHDTCAILPACRTRKMHTTRRDAFKAVNDTAYAKITYPELGVEQLREYPAADGKLLVRPFKEKLKVGLLHLHPQLYAEEISLYTKWDGLIIEVLGIGHAPTMVTDNANKENKNILAAITELAKRMPVAAAPQTIYGRVNMNVYTPGRQLLEAGVLGQNLDMTPETAFVKLAWLLSNYKKAEVRALYGENLRGEISQRSEQAEFDI